MGVLLFDLRLLWISTEAFFISLRPGRMKTKSKKILNSSPGMKPLCKLALKRMRDNFRVTTFFLFLELHSLKLPHAVCCDSRTSLTVPEWNVEMIKIWAKLLFVLQGKWIILSVIKALGAEKDLSSGYLAIASFYWDTSQRLKICQIITRFALLRKKLILQGVVSTEFFFLHLLELPGTCLRCTFAQ